MDAALTPKAGAFPRTGLGFRACEKEPPCWVERSVSHRRPRGPGFWCRSHSLASRTSSPSCRGRKTEMPARKSKIKVMIADDHAILRAGLRFLVNAQPDMEVVAEAPDGEAAIQAARETTPHVALMDLTMPRTGGMRALQEIARDCAETRVLVLTMHDDPAYLRAVLAAGASGYVLKRSVDAELLTAIRAVHRGGTFVDPSLANVLVQDVLGKDVLGKKG